MLIKIEHQEQIGYQTGQQLEEHAVWVSGDEMVDIRMVFPHY